MNEVRNDAAFFDEVTKHQAANKWRAAWDEDATDESDDNREEDLLGLAHFFKRLHLDASLFLGGAEFDDWREDDWNRVLGPRFPVSSFFKENQEVKEQ